MKIITVLEKNIKFYQRTKPTRVKPLLGFHPLRARLSLSRGFTLIELLIVISILGMLSGVVIGVINPDRQKAIATDAVTQTIMNKFIEGFEAYHAANSTYPSEASVAAGTVSYIHSGALPTTMYYTLNGTGDIFYLCNASLTSAGVYFVYDSSVGSIFKCGTGQVVTNCMPYGCLPMLIKISI